MDGKRTKGPIPHPYAQFRIRWNNPNRHGNARNGKDDQQLLSDAQNNRRVEIPLIVIEGNIDGVEHMPLKLFHSLTHKLVQLIEILDAG